jgi:hypothetical protein
MYRETRQMSRDEMRRCSSHSDGLRLAPASAPRPTIDAALYTLPSGSVAFDRGEEIVLVRTGAPRGIGQAQQLGADRVDAPRQIAEACVEPTNRTAR